LPLETPSKECEKTETKTKKFAEIKYYISSILIIVLRNILQFMYPIVFYIIRWVETNGAFFINTSHRKNCVNGF
jgi:NADH:ubiquinone oxidoreductase subunit 3 (subunit A)